jgi:outer membrane lipoprotein-sorting protein
MLRLRVIVCASVFLVVCGLFVRAQDNAALKAIVKKAIEAHGGEKNLAKYTAADTKFKGTMEIQGNKFDITGQTLLQKPDKVKNIMKLDIAGNLIDVVTVFDGKKLWVSTAGQTKEIDDEKIIKAAREELQSEGAGNLTEILKAPYELNAIGEVKVKGKDAIGIRVSKKGQKDISIFFDKKTHLVIKTEMVTLDANTMQEVTQEKFILDYRDKNGHKIPQRVEIVKDGKTFMDIEITESTPLEKLDDSHFAKP